MPIFFEKAKLAPEQLARWDAAIAEYNRVREANIEASISRMPEKEKAALVDSMAKGWVRTGHLDEDVRRILSMGFFSGNGAGDCKSALFFRLLEGKPALDEPPPTSFSYPWYEVVEGDGPFHVMLGGVQSLGATIAAARGANRKRLIVINQCSWAVESMNAAAEALLRLDAVLAETSVPEAPRSLSRSYTWTQELLDGVKAAYAAGPEIRARHGGRPACRLALGPHASHGTRRHFEEPITPERLKNCGSVFDAGMIMDKSIGATVARGEDPRVRIERLRKGDDAGFGRLRLEICERSLATDIEEFERDPDGLDAVEAGYLDWYLWKDR